jgi:hypothetical protein
MRARCRKDRESATIRQTEVNQHQVGTVIVGKLFDQTNSFVGVFGNNHFARFTEQLPEYGYGDEGVFRVILNQEHPDSKFR